MLIVSPSLKITGLVSAMARALQFQSLPSGLVGAQALTTTPATVYAHPQDLAETPLAPAFCLIDLEACRYEAGADEPSRLYADLAMFKLLHPTCLIVLTGARPNEARVRGLVTGLGMLVNTRVLSHTELAEPERWVEFLRRYQCLLCFHQMTFAVQKASMGLARGVAEASHVFGLMRAAPSGSDVGHAIRTAHWPATHHTSQSVSRTLRAVGQVNPKTLLDAVRLAAYIHVKSVAGTTKAQAAAFLHVRSQAEYRRHLRQTGGLPMARIDRVTPAQATGWLAAVITTPQCARITLAALLPTLVEPASPL